MSDVRGCRVPEDLYYWPEKHVWARPEPDGTVTIGITDAAQHLAKTIISVTPAAWGARCNVARAPERSRAASGLVR